MAVAGVSRVNDLFAVSGFSIVGPRLERALLEHAQVVLGVSEGAIRHLGEQESDPVEA